MKRVAEADLRLLQVFRTIAACGGFAGAQAQLNLSDSSISTHVASLEQRLGMRLCNRGRGGFSLTDKGVLIHREAERLFTAIEEFSEAAGEIRGRMVGRLRIGTVDCTVSDPNAPLSRAIARFNARENDVKIEVSVQAPQDLQRGLIEGRLSLAVGSFPARITALHSQTLYRERQGFYCGSGHPLFEKDVVSIEDIRNHRVVSRGYWRRADIDRLGIENESAMVDNMEAQAMLILSGTYLGYLPKHYAAAWVSSGKLRALLPRSLDHESVFSLLTSKNHAPLLVVQNFIEDLRNSVRRSEDTDTASGRRKRPLPLTERPA